MAPNISLGTVVFVGSNPSQKGQTNTPWWHNVKSTKILLNWIEEIDATDLYDAAFLNVSNEITPNNRPLTKIEVMKSLAGLHYRLACADGTKVVALGKTAEFALTLLGVDHYAMPHPSGLNRQLNDKAFVAEKIKGLSDYLRPSKIE